MSASALPHRRRWPFVLILLLLLLAALTLAASYWGVRVLKERVERSLGPEAEIGAILLRWDRVEIRGLRLKAPAGWPALDTLRADSIELHPDLGSLWNDHQIRIDRIRVLGGYLSALRTPQGRLRVIPSLLEKKSEGGTPALPLTIDKVELIDSTLEFFDASIRQPPLKLRLEQVQAAVTDIRLPGLKGQSAISLTGLLKGPQRDGSVAIDGSLEVASKESRIDTRLRDIDLVLLSPYLAKSANTGVKSGSLDLDMTATVHNNKLQAPGNVVLHDLELDDSGGFMGMARRGTLSLAKDREQKIGVKFELSGDLNDPHFKLNESLAARFAVGLADSIGLSLGGLVEGAGNLGQKSVEAVGGALRKLFGESTPKEAAKP